MTDVEARFRDLATVTYPEGSASLAALVLLFLVSFGAAVFNTFLMFLFVADRGLRSPATFLVLNLSVIDWTLGVCNSTIYAINLSHKRWAVGEIGGQANGFIVLTLCAASLIGLALLGIERWLVMVKHRRLEMRHTLYMVTFNWVFALTLATIPFWFGKKYVLEGSTLYFAGNWADTSPAGLFFTIMCLGVVSGPLIVFALSYVQIWKVIREQNQRWAGVDDSQGSSLGVSSSDHNNSSSNNQTNTPTSPTPMSPAKFARMSKVERKKERRNAELERTLAKKALIVVCVFVLNWSLYDINFLVELFSGKQMSSTLDAVATVSCVFNSCINPILFIVLDVRFSSAARRVLRLRPRSSTLHTAPSSNTFSLDSSSHLTTLQNSQSQHSRDVKPTLSPVALEGGYGGGGFAPNLPPLSFEDSQRVVSQSPGGTRRGEWEREWEMGQGYGQQGYGYGQQQQQQGYAQQGQQGQGRSSFVNPQAKFVLRPYPM